MAIWRSASKDAVQQRDTYVRENDYRDGEVSDGSLVYVSEQSGNNSGPSYQEASGAPVESVSPLGYSVGPVTIFFLNLSKMIGTGIYSTPASILSGTGSVGLSMIYWVLGFLMSVASLSVYLEFASYFPNRSGSEVAYLEQAYPRPKFLLSTAFAFQTIVLTFSSSNAIVLAEYVFRMSNHTPSPWELKGVAVAGYSLAFLCVSFHTKFSYRFSNLIGLIKVLTLVFISITGFVVLGGHTRVENPTANFDKPFEGHATPYGITNALIKVLFSYHGYENAFNVVNEVKNPVKQIKRHGSLALLAVTVLYVLANIAYFSAVPKDELAASKQVAAALFFDKVFGSGNASRGLNFLICLSSFGNLLTVLLGASRVIRECGRQGVLPWPRFWASTAPFGTPLGPYAFKWGITMVMILAPPAGDAFNFVVNLRSYPQAVFSMAMGVGLFLVRWRRNRVGLPRDDFKAWSLVVVFRILIDVFVLVMPWYPPEGGIYDGDVSFFYGTYILTGIGIIIGCCVYYWLWIYFIPKLRGYRIRQQVITLDGGATTHRITKVPVGDLEDWDATHDAVGRTHDVQVITPSPESSITPRKNGNSSTEV